MSLVPTHDASHLPQHASRRPLLVTQFLQQFYPGYVMGDEDHLEEGEVRHEPVIDPETERIVREAYAKDYILWELVQKGAYYPPNWRNCTAKLPDGSHASPPTSARSQRGVFERSLQPTSSG